MVRPNLREAFDALLEAKRRMEALVTEKRKPDFHTSEEFSGMGIMEEWGLIITSSSSALCWADEEKQEFIQACGDQDKEDRKRRFY